MLTEQRAGKAQGAHREGLHCPANAPEAQRGEGRAIIPQFWKVVPKPLQVLPLQPLCGWQWWEGGVNLRAMDTDPPSLKFFLCLGVPMLCTGTWVGCKLAFEDIG